MEKAHHAWQICLKAPIILLFKGMISIFHCSKVWFQSGLVDCQSGVWDRQYTPPGNTFAIYYLDTPGTYDIGWHQFCAIGYSGFLKHGRASCRDRVGQYGYISVGAQTLKQ